MTVAIDGLAVTMILLSEHLPAQAPSPLILSVPDGRSRSSVTEIGNMLLSYPT